MIIIQYKKNNIHPLMLFCKIEYRNVWGKLLKDHYIMIKL